MAKQTDTAAMMATADGKTELPRETMHPLTRARRRHQAVMHRPDSSLAALQTLLHQWHSSRTGTDHHGAN